MVRSPPVDEAAAAVAPAERTAAIAVIGDEILSGKYAEENARFAIGALRELGVRLRRIEIVPDDLDDIAATVVAMSRRFDLVITSGGVGPTHDDVTIAGIARGFGVRVVHEPRLLEMLRRYHGAEPDEAQRRLAEVPEGAVLVDGPGLTVPVVCFANVYILPGVPSLFRKKLTGLGERFRGRPFVTGRLYLAVDETAIAGRLTAVALASPDVAIGSYPRFDDVEFQLVLTVEGKDLAAVERAMADLVAALGELVVRTDGPG